jgi:hypothetical protein
MRPRFQIERRATVNIGGSLPGVHPVAAIFTLDDLKFESGIPSSLSEALEINSALDRLVDFVNAVAVVK